MSPALAGGFLTTGPPGKSLVLAFSKTSPRDTNLQLQLGRTGFMSPFLLFWSMLIEWNGEVRNLS